MASILLVIIYIAFISLGLPDSLLGSAWPVMHQDIAAPISYAGIITMILQGGTIVSSLASDRMTRKFGTGLVTAVSVGLTACGMLGFSLSHAFWQLCLLAVPYGLGAGAIDAALNNYVALHYKARHMSWLHCFWGIGCSVSPYIMAYAIAGPDSWHGGYQIVGLMQIVLTVAMFLSLPLWRKTFQTETLPSDASADPDITEKHLGVSGAWKISGVPYLLFAFTCYSAVEATSGLWASTYLVQTKGIDVETAARFASLFYLGITFGRFLNGFITERFGDRSMIRIGIGIIFVGILMMILPIPVQFLPLAGLIVIGLGCAPIYPSIIHATPANFGPENSQAIIGIQMAFAYIGSTLCPPLFGLIADVVGTKPYPFFIAFFAAVMLFLSEKVNQAVDRNHR